MTVSDCMKKDRCFSIGFEAYKESGSMKFPSTARKKKILFFDLPTEIKLRVYYSLTENDLLNFHLAFLNFTVELVPIHYLNSSAECCYYVWPEISLERNPTLIEEELILSALHLTLDLKVSSWKVYGKMNERLRCKVTVLSNNDNAEKVSFAQLCDLAEMSRHYNNLKVLNLTNNEITDEGAMALAKALRSKKFKLEKLNLCRNRIGNDGAIEMANAINSENCKLLELNLWSNLVGIDGAKALADSIKSRNCKLETLILRNNPLIQDEGAIALANAVQSGQCNLKKLDLLYCEIRGEGVLAMANAIKSSNCSLTNLGFGSFESSLEEIMAIIKAIEFQSCNLETLVLDLGIGDEALKGLSNALTSKHCSIKELSFICHQVGIPGLEALADALQCVNCQLESLKIPQNGIGDKGAKMIAKAIGSETCNLRILDLSNNGIGNEGAAAFAIAMRSKCGFSLKYLDLSQNEKFNYKILYALAAFSAGKCKVDVWDDPYDWDDYEYLIF